MLDTCSNIKSGWKTKSEQQHLKSFKDMSHLCEIRHNYRVWLHSTLNLYLHLNSWKLYWKCLYLQITKPKIQNMCFTHIILNNTCQLKVWGQFEACNEFISGVRNTYLKWHPEAQLMRLSYVRLSGNMLISNEIILK